MKGDIHIYVLSTSIFLSNIGELKFRQNTTGYQIIKIVKFSVIPYSKKLIPSVVLPVSRLLNIAQIVLQ